MRVTLLTPTHGGDLERFLLQRESIERCAIDIPHLAVVDHEDLPRFRDLPFQRNLTLVSTREVLPRVVEMRRRACHLPRSSPVRWISKWHGGAMHGWGVQQLVKLAAPVVVSTPAYVCMDSDTLFVRKVECADFFDSTGMGQGAKPFLYETFDDVDAEMAEWSGRAMRFLGVKPTKMPVSRFTHSPVVMRRDVVLDLQRFIEKKHGKPWMRAIEEFGMVMEYSTYGVFAKYVDGLSRVALSKPEMSAYFWWADEVKEMEKTFDSRTASDEIRIVAIQSNAGRNPSDYRPLLEKLWPAASEHSARSTAVVG